ncbi:MAG: pantetheine-phosphate adenylyltransferase [Dehalococcoidia bacterium]|nr:pantetheine-phosphate adenylyltransferase [Dehalococcoidia bacterium]
MVRAIYPGSFDPLTLGHLDIAVRASKLFDEVIVAVYDAPPKRLLFETEERMALWREALPPGVTNVSVVPYKGLTVDLAHQFDASVLVRGLRALSDFEYELEMNLTNRRMAPDIESVFLMSSHEYLYLSSTRIKEVWGLGHKLADMVPANVNRALTERLQQTDRG